MSPRDQILVQQYALAMGQKPRNSLNGMPTAELYRADIVKAARLWRFHENARHAFSMRPVDAYLASQ